MGRKLERDESGQESKRRKATLIFSHFHLRLHVLCCVQRTHLGTVDIPACWSLLKWAPNWQVIDFPEAIREKGKVLGKIMETEPRPLSIWAEAD